MEPANARPELAPESPTGPAQYNLDRGSRHEAPAASHRRRSSRIRVAYFIASSIWGFAIGVLAIAAGANVSGQPLRLTPATSAALVSAFVMAVVGGWVAAAAYREARNRARR